uniref:PDZ domain-containing protein n=1 Tax=Haemonchus contortus TaxID=6289 RepID=A0A7I4YUU9_HAECO
MQPLDSSSIMPIKVFKLPSSKENSGGKPRPYSRESPVEIPKEYCETYVVRKPMGARIHKSDCRITHIDVNSVLTNKIFVGDTIIALDGEPITSAEEIYQKLKGSSERVAVKVRHGMWSWCEHRCTTLERIQMDKDTEKVTGRPIDVYYVAIQLSSAPELRNVQLGLNVKYDARERLQVHNVDYSSIAAVHLRPGDIIREVDDKPVASKTMLKYYVSESIAKNRRICFLIECPAGEAYRECYDMAPDVTEIALKQIERFKKTVNQMPAVSAYSSAHSKKSVSIAPQERTEVEIAADFDPTKLRPCKNAK